MSTQPVSASRIVALTRDNRTRLWLNAVNLHWTGVALLGAINLFLLVQIGLAWKLATSQDAEALAQQRIQLRAAEIAAKPLEGLDVKLAAAGEQADRFYMERLPVSYSEIASELGVLKTKTGVRLGRVNYAQPGAAGGSGGNKELATIGSDRFGGKLTEVQLDASLTGDYRGLVQFLNGLERDKVFFLINGVTLTGQQTGQVSLRVRLTTYLRGSVPTQEAEKAFSSPIGELDQAVEVQGAKQGGVR